MSTPWVPCLFFFPFDRPSVNMCKNWRSVHTPFFHIYSQTFSFLYGLSVVFRLYKDLYMAPQF